MSSIDDDALERAGAAFGGPEYGDSGFGISDLTTELLSRDPKYVPVTDLKKYQQGLIATGYARGVTPDGAWSPFWSAAARRSERDAFQTVRGGSHFLAAPVKKFFEYLGHTLPSSVFEGVLGIATGIGKDAMKALTSPVEVAEEGGVLGTAAVGAIGGAAVGSVVPVVGTALGALVGGAGGAVGGFFADFFGDDEQEENQDGWHKILDALTPVDEIKAGDASNLFAALSTVMTASAVLKGASVAVKGTQAALAGPSLAPSALAPRAIGAQVAGGIALPTVAMRSTSTVAEAGFRAAFSRAAPSSVGPGLAAQLARGAINKPIVGGAVVGGLADSIPEFLVGDFGAGIVQFGRGTAIGAVTGPIAKRLAPKKATELALKGLNAAPLMRVAESGAGKVARAGFTGVSAGTIGGRLAGELPGKQSVEEAMERYEGTAGLPGHIADMTFGLVVYPERLLPWRSRDISRAVQELGSDSLLLPLARAAQRMPDGTRVSVKRGFERVKEAYGKHPVTGQFDESYLGVRVFFTYVNKGLDDAAGAAARARGIKGQGALRDYDLQIAQAEERSELISKMYDEAGVKAVGTIEEAEAVQRSPLAKELFENARSNPHSMQAHVEDFEGQGSLIEHISDHQRASESLMERTRTMRAEIEGAENVFLIPAVRDDAANGVTGYQTQQHFTQAAKDYEDAAGGWRSAFEAAKDAGEDITHPLVLARTEAGRRLDDLLLDLKRRRMIDDAKYQELRPGGGLPTVDDKLPKELRRIAGKRPAEIAEESDRLATTLGTDRYIALSTGENMLTYDHIPKLLEVSGAAEMARRTPFRDALAGLAEHADRLDVGRLRYVSIQRALDPVAEKYGLGTGRQLADKLYDNVRGRYDELKAANAGEQLRISRTGTRVTRRKTATGETEREWYRVVPADLSAGDIKKALDLEAPINGVDPLDVSAEIKRQLMVGAAYGADANLASVVAHPIATARNLVEGLRINGLPGFNDFMRTAELPLHKLPGIGKWAKQGSYGYIPHHLRKAHMAVQFSLSPTFDASRYIEAMSFGRMHDIPIRAALAPRKYIRENEWTSPLSGQKVSSDDAYQQMIQFGDQVFHGRVVMQNLDELQLRSMHHGILGFKPREVEYAHAWTLAQRRLAKKGTLDPKDLEDIRETVLQIHQYGARQTAFGNSMHFVFFPFLFGFKQLRQIHDYTLGAPVRNLLVHEGFRRWYSVTGEDGKTLSEKFTKEFEQHVPLAREVARLNNLSYGLSLGRSFLKGIMDKDTEGKWAQGIASFLLPGGVHQPVAEATGATADALKQFFIPVILNMDPDIYVEDGKRKKWTIEALSIMERLVPVYRDLDRWFFENDFGTEGGVIGQTFATVSEGMAPMQQFQALMDFKRVEGVALDALATQAGYASYDSLAASHPEVSQAVRDINLAVGANYPSGQEMATEFQNSAAVKDQILYRIGQKERRTDAEEVIFTIGEMERQAKAIAAETGRTQEEVLRMIAPVVRGFAGGYLDDRQFNNLWEELYANSFGPLRVIA